MEYTDETIMPFGKYKGRMMANVPADYLLWVRLQDWVSNEMLKYINDNLDALKKEK